MRAMWLPLAVLLLFPLPLGCVTDTSCTQIACEHEAVVTFPSGLVSGAYGLILEGERETATARCLDPGSEEGQANPEGLRCDAMGFTLEGHPLANERELRVTVILDDGAPVVESVRLEAVDERTPNGPDCPPICFIRNGQLRLGSGG